MTALRRSNDALDLKLIGLLAARQGHIDRATELKRESGLPARIPAGEVVTTGTLTDAWPVAPGETWRADFDGLGLAPVTLRLLER